MTNQIRRSLLSETAICPPSQSQRVGSTRLALAVAAIALGGLSMLGSAGPAIAACAPIGTVVECVGTTTTTDVTFPTSLTKSRDYNVNLLAVPITGANIGVGETITGFGLSIRNGTPVGTVTVTNADNISVTAGNTPTAGGSSAALFISGQGGLITYTQVGPGGVQNNGTGDGLSVVSTTGAQDIQLGSGTFKSSTGVAVSGNSSGGTISITGSALGSVDGKNSRHFRQRLRWRGQRYRRLRGRCDRWC